MDLLTTVYYIMIDIWYIAGIALIIYLYKSNYVPHKVKFRDYYYTEIPSDLDPGEISMLMYHKIEPQVFTTTILTLIQKGIIELKQKNGEYYFKVIDSGGRVKLSRSENVVREFLEGIGKNKEFTLTEFEQFCGTKKGDSEFLFQYDLFKNIIMRESSRKHFFEQKKGYSFVKIMRNLGILLFITNILGRYHLISGYGLVLPILFIPFFFKTFYRRTEQYSEEYEKWTSFQNYLNELELFKEVEEFNSYTKCAIVLGSMEKLHQRKPNDKSIAFANNLNNIVLKCYRHAYLNGNRSISNLWNLK